MSDSPESPVVMFVLVEKIDCRALESGSSNLKRLISMQTILANMPSMLVFSVEIFFLAFLLGTTSALNDNSIHRAKKQSWLKTKLNYRAEEVGVCSNQ